MFISLSFRFHENMFSERHAEHVESVAMCSSLATPYGIINRTGWTCKEYQLIGPVENLISRWRESQSNNTKLTQPTIMWKMGQRRSFFRKKHQTKKLVHVGRRQNASRTRKLLGTMWQAAKNCVVDVVVHGICVWYCTVKRFRTDSVKCHRARKVEHLHSNQKQYGQYGHPSYVISPSDYPLVSSNMAGWKSLNWMEVLLGKSLINGPFSSKPCLIARVYTKHVERLVSSWLSATLRCCLVSFPSPLSQKGTRVCWSYFLNVEKPMP